MLGSAVGPYEIVDKLGAGGMGEVFLGHDPRLQRRVALKRLTAAASGASDDNARVLREARAVARLNHPNIAAVYDVLQQDGRTFIVMEYVEGESLSARMARARIPIDQVRLIGRQLASALAAAHAQGVIHRDLKPANIHIAPDGSIKVLDFGVAKLSPSSSGPGSPAGEAMNEHTIAGNPGTPIYMSPEQLFSRPLDARSDIYSAGVILFQMATGRRPYEQLNAVGLALAMSTSAPRPAQSINPQIPDDLNATIAKALEHDPDHRFQSARDLEQALADDVSRTGVLRPAVSPRGLPRPWVVAIAAAIVVTVGAVAWRPLVNRAGLTRQVAIAPTVLAIMPADNPTGDPHAEYVGAGIASVVARNFGSLAGVSVLSRASTAPYAKQKDDLAALRRELGATHVLNISVRRAAPRPVIVARLQRTTADSADWEETVEGEVLTIEQTLLDALGRALDRARAFPRALTAADWSRIRRLPTTSAEALDAYSEARALLDRYDVPGNVDRAIGLLTRATATDPKFAEAYAALGDAQWIRYQYLDKRAEVAARATAAVMEALRLDPEAAPVYYSLGNMQYRTGQYESAVTSLRRAIELQPDADEPHRLLGLVLAAKGDVDAAVVELHRAIQMLPRWNNYMSLGYVLHTAGRYNDAIDALRKAIELQPSNSEAYQLLGTTYHMIGDLPQAIGNYEHAARLAPNAYAYGNLALAYYAAKRFDEARDAYLEGIKFDPHNASLHRDLADVYRRLGRAGEARAMYDKAIALAQEQLKVNPRDALSVVLIAICEARTGRRAQAERHAAEAVALDPTNRGVRLRAAKVYAELGDRSAAIDAVRAAVALGYELDIIRSDDELAMLRGADLEQALAAGLNDRKTRGVRAER